MNEWSGEVYKVSERDWGTKTLYSWQLKGANLWFRSETKPNVEEGKCYTFKGDSPNKVDISTIQEISESALKQEAVAQRTDTVPPTSSPDYWRWKQLHDIDREEAFMWRDARADATRIVASALENDCLMLGSKKAARLDILLGMVHEVTEKLVGDMREKINGS